MNDDLFQNIHGNMIFSAYSVKIIFIFATNMILPFCQKNQDGFLLKNTLKDDIFHIPEKDILENMGFLLKYHIDQDSRLAL